MSQFIVDVQLPPSLATMLRIEFLVEAYHVQDVTSRQTPDRDIAVLARERDAIIISKDNDFRGMARTNSLRVIFVSCGNVRNSRLRELFRGQFATALALIESGEYLVEITG